MGRLDSKVWAKNLALKSISLLLLVSVAACTQSNQKPALNVSAAPTPQVDPAAHAKARKAHRPTNYNMFSDIASYVKKRKSKHATVASNKNAVKPKASISKEAAKNVDTSLRTASLPTQASGRKAIVPISEQSLSNAINEQSGKVLRNRQVLFSKSTKENELLLPPGSLPSLDDENLRTAYHGNSNLPSTGKLALSTIIDDALRTTPEIGAALAREREAYYGVSQSKSAFKPKLNLETSSGPESSRSQLTGESQGVRNEVSFTADQTIYDFGVSHGDLRRRKLLYKSAHYNRVKESEDTALEVIEAAYDVLRQRELHSVASSNVKAHQRFAKLVKISEREGNSTVADVKRVTTRLDSARNTLIDIESALQSANNAFYRIAGVKAKRLKSVRKLSASVTPSRDSEIEDLIKKNPALIAAFVDQESLIEQTKQQYGTKFPELFARLEVRYRQDIGGDVLPNQSFRAFVGFRFNIYDGGEKKAILEQIRSRVDESVFNYRRVYGALVEEMRSNLQTLRSSREKIGILKESRAAARKVVELYSDQFKFGNRTLFELLDAQADLYSTETDFITNKFDAGTASFNNLRLRGGLLNYLGKSRARSSK